MADYFVLFQEPRRPWIDLDRLKQKFLAYSAQVHPDRVHGALEEAKRAAQERYTELNAAYNCLREPKELLLHLLELESGDKPKNIERVSATEMGFFLQVGQTIRDVDAFLAAKAKVASPLLRAQSAGKGLEWMDALNALQLSIQAQRQKLLEELRSMNRKWETAPEVGSEARRAALPLERLEEIYRLLSYLSRWRDQIQERIVNLAI